MGERYCIMGGGGLRAARHPAPGAILPGMDGESTPRRAPRQARGRARVERILAAAAELFGTVGYEATTTNAIAERARTSIGSVYQFFPNKQAILQALANRYLADLRPLIDVILADAGACDPLPDVVDRLIDTLAAFHATRPAFVHVFHRSLGSAELAASAEDLNAAIVERLRGVLMARDPGLAEGRADLVAAVSVEVVKAMLALAASAPGDGAFQARLMAETKRLLVRYLQPDGTGELHGAGVPIAGATGLG